MLKPSPRIRQARLVKKMTQVELARELGVTRQTMSNLENGHTLPNLAVLFSIADILGVPWTSLYANEKEG